MKLLTPFRLKKIRKYLSMPNPHILDVGISGKSPSLTKKAIPRCKYIGLEKPETKKYYLVDNDTADVKAIDHIIYHDLNESFPPFTHRFDVVIFASVIEHLDNPYFTLGELAHLVQPSGLLYVEYPNINSFKAPKIFWDSHFSHEPEHQNVTPTLTVINLLLKNHFTIISAGRRRDWFVILLTPILMPTRMILRLINGGPLFSGGDVYDLFGYADYVLARKNV